MYKVIKFFTDLQDNSRPYNVGDTYPRKGLIVSDARIAELASSNNKQRQPLIKEVKVKKPIDEVAEVLPESASIEDAPVENTAEETKSSRRKRK